MPDEADRQARAFIAFGAQPAIWKDFTPDVQAAQGRIARAIARYQPVTVFCREAEMALARRHCGDANVTYLAAELDDIWMRDIGANFLVNGQGGLTAMDFNFNGWGDKQRHAADALLAGRAARGRTRATCAASWWARAAASRWTAAAPAS
ncbi:agmatine deiminase family protein [Achromobacter xylosoxidans]